MLVIAAYRRIAGAAAHTPLPITFLFTPDGSASSPASRSFIDRGARLPLCARHRACVTAGRSRTARKGVGFHAPAGGRRMPARRPDEMLTLASMAEPCFAIEHERPRTDHDQCRPDQWRHGAQHGCGRLHDRGRPAFLRSAHASWRAGAKRCWCSNQCGRISRLGHGQDHAAAVRRRSSIWSSTALPPSRGESG